MIFPIYESLNLIDDEYPYMVLNDKENVYEDILSAIKYLKTINISQNDVKNENILYDRENEKKIY